MNVTVKLVWNLFDDTRPLSKATLSKLSNVIHYHIEGKGLPSSSVMFMEELSLAEDLWRVICSTLEYMVVSRLEIKDIDEVRKSCRLT